MKEKREHQEGCREGSELMKGNKGERNKEEQYHKKKEKA